MKDRTKKGLITLFAVALIGTTGATLTACNSEGYNMSGWMTYSTAQDTYIVMFENDGSTLHKGDVYSNYSKSGYGAIGDTVSTLKFDCSDGKDPQTNLFISYPEMPENTKYDHVCPKCFPTAQQEEQGM